MFKRLRFLYLDILSIPSLFMSKRLSARLHLLFICPQCPGYRRKLRDVDGKGECWWYRNWIKGNFDLPINFGMKNWVTQYLYLRT